MEELRTAVRQAVERMASASEALDAADEETADLEDLQRAFDEAEAEHRAAAERLERAETVAEARSKAPVEPVKQAEGKVEVGKEPLTYERHNGNSVFRDLVRRDTDPDAAARLARHSEEMAVERRDLSSTDSAGGYLVAPLYLQDEFVSLARAGRVTADVVGAKPLPPNTDSINIPTLSTGVSTAAQADNAAVSETDAVFDTIAADVKTIAGMQDVSQQLVDRSVPGVDDVIFADLVSSYAVTLDTAVLNSAVSNNLGLLQVSGINTQTYTDASPTAGELYPKIADAIQEIHTGIYMPASAVIMHPRRWAFFLAATDTTNRPLITPYAPQNAQGNFGGVVAEGAVGSIQGLPVYVDANVPVGNGASTNEDTILVIRREDCYLWEDAAGPYLDTFRDVGSGTLTVRFRLFNYYAQCHARRPRAISAISGTGLATPSF